MIDKSLSVGFINSKSPVNPSPDDLVNKSFTPDSGIVLNKKSADRIRIFHLFISRFSVAYVVCQ